MVFIQPIISVIVPCYNQAKYLDDALNSILDQTFIDWECIIVNDGSKDNTQDIAEKFCSIDNRFLLISKSNGGLASARNAGLKIAKGDYVQFLDADDIIFPDKFTIQINSLTTAHAQLAICNYAIKTIQYDKITVQDVFIQPLDDMSPICDLINFWENGISIPCHSVIISNAFLKTNNISFCEDLINHEDWAFWVEVFMHNPIFCKVDETLCFYMRRGYTMSSNKYLMRKGFLNAINYLQKKYLSHENGKYYQSLFKQKRRFVIEKYSGHQPFSLQRIRKKIKYLHYFIFGKITISAFRNK